MYGAACNPPLKRAGRTVYVAFDKLPSRRFKAPTVPAAADAANPGNCQHSSTELPRRPAMAVRLRLGVVVFESAGGGQVVWAAARRARL